MRQVNDAFRAELKRGDSRPVYVLDIPSAGIRIATGTNPFGGTPFGLTPSGTAARVDPQRARASLGELVFSHIDPTFAETFVLSSIPWAEARVFEGFRDIGVDEWELLHVGRIGSVDFAEDQITWSLALLDRGSELKGGILQAPFDPETQFFAARPLSLALHLMTTTAGGENGPYDLGWAGFGMGIPIANIDLEAWELAQAELDDDPSNGLQINIPGRAQGSGRSYVQSTLLAPFGFYEVIGADGRLSVRRIPPINPTTDPRESLTRRSLIASRGTGTGARAPKVEFEDPINVIEVVAGQASEERPLAGFSKTLYLEESIAVYTEQSPTSLRYLDASNLEAGWQQSGGGFKPTFIEVWRRFFERYACPQPKYKAQSQFRASLIEPGDVVDFDPTQTPVFTDNSLGGSRALQVLRKNPNFREGIVAWEGLGFYEHERCRFRDNSFDLGPGEIRKRSIENTDDGDPFEDEAALHVFGERQAAQLLELVFSFRVQNNDRIGTSAVERLYLSGAYRDGPNGPTMDLTTWQFFYDLEGGGDVFTGSETIYLWAPTTWAAVFDRLSVGARKERVAGTAEETVFTGTLDSVRIVAYRWNDSDGVPPGGGGVIPPRITLGEIDR